MENNRRTKILREKRDSEANAAMAESISVDGDEKMSGNSEK